MYSDSVDKIMMYMTSLIKGDAVIDGRKYFEKKIIVSPLILREIKCHRNCGACCHISFTLDYLPNEHPENSCEREVCGKKIYTIFPDKNLNYCQYLNLNNGNCNIHDYSPFTCDFELIRFKQFISRNEVLIGTFPFGRCWNMMRYDGVNRGGLCIKSTYSESYKKDVIRKLYRLKDWIEYYNISTYIDELIDCVDLMNDDKGKPIFLNHKNLLF